MGKKEKPIWKEYADAVEADDFIGVGRALDRLREKAMKILKEPPNEER